MSDVLVEALERSLGEKLRRFFQRRLRNHADAADATQETFLRLLKAAPPAGPIENPQAYVFRVARNLALDHERQRRARGRVESPVTDERIILNVASDLASPEQQVIDRQRLKVFDEALAALPPRARQVFVMSRMENCSHAEIAARLGVSARTVYGDVRMAMAHCFDALTRLERD